MDWRLENRRGHIYHLSELTSELKMVIQDHFRRPVWIKAEISSIKKGQKGHYYLELVENRYGIIESKAQAMVWASHANRIIPHFEAATGTRLSKGMTILFQGSVVFHIIYGFSIHIQFIDPEYTLGEMAREREAVIARLRKEGFMEMNKELLPPTVPQRLAIIAAPGSKGLNDFTKTLQTHCHAIAFETTLFAAIMQGENAAPDIIRNLRIIEAQHQDYDVIILIRGGGAELDLTCFDEYELCAILAQVSLPVITGIGHTDDETICDLIASQRTKTPTDAAMFICGAIADFQQRLQTSEEALHRHAQSALEMAKTNLKGNEQRLQRELTHRIHFQNSYIQNLSTNVKRITQSILDQEKEQIARTTATIKQKSNLALFQQKNLLTRNHLLMESNVKNRLLREEERIRNLQKLVQILHPENTLRRGFSITLKEGKALTDSSSLKEGDQVETTLFKGSITSMIIRNTHNNDKEN
ncbi:MAG: exodeoxyribonuclease VII large subunit [Bacteroidetes bacterium]|nr:MAG: exodeoxyribonuclease VII large subunit [Bacteroidota bacterium]